MAASTDSSARSAVAGRPRRQGRVALGELDPRLRHGQRVSQLVRHEAREAGEPSAARPPPCRCRAAAAPLRRPGSACPRCRRSRRARTSGCAGSCDVGRPRAAHGPAAIRRVRAGLPARRAARSRGPTPRVAAPRSCARTGGARRGSRRSRAAGRRTRRAVRGSPRPPPRAEHAHARRRPARRPARGAPSRGARARHRPAAAPRGWRQARPRPLDGSSRPAARGRRSPASRRRKAVSRTVSLSCQRARMRCQDLGDDDDGAGDVRPGSGVGARPRGR